MTQDTTFAIAFKSLSHPRRMAIFRRLAERPETGASHATLQRSLNIPHTSFHHHVAMMQRTGLVLKRRAGAEVQLRLATGPLTDALLAALSLSDRSVPRPRRAA